MRTLLALTITELTTSEIGKHMKPGMVHLPEWCLTDKGKIQRTEYYHQFAYEGHIGDEKHILLDAQTLDDILHEEISNAGLEDLLAFDLTPFINAFRERGMIKKYEELHRTLGVSSYLVVNLEYRNCGSYEDPYDWELDVEIDGILDSKFNFVEVEMNTKNK